jgi:YHS domain-containing protein
MKTFLSLISMVMLTLTIGCATLHEQSSSSTAGASAQCEVCRYRNDLACVCVKVTEKTPRVEYHGTTYYFCSEECREAFLKKPAKYAGK